MNPVLFALLLIVGLACLWQAWVYAWWDGNLRDSAPLWVPVAIIGLSVLTAAGLGMAGVIA